MRKAFSLFWTSMAALLLTASAALGSQGIIRIAIYAPLLSVREDGSLLAGSSRTLKAFDAGFKQLWSWTAPSEISAVEWAASGQAYAGVGMILTKLDGGGKTLWSIEANDRIYTLKALDGGRVAVGTGYGAQAYNAVGGLIWEHYPENQIHPSTDCST